MKRSILKTVVSLTIAVCVGIAGSSIYNQMRHSQMNSNEVEKTTSTIMDVAYDYSKEATTEATASAKEDTVIVQNMTEAVTSAKESKEFVGTETTTSSGKYEYGVNVNFVEGSSVEYTFETPTQPHTEPATTAVVEEKKVLTEVTTTPREVVTEAPTTALVEVKTEAPTQAPTENLAVVTSTQPKNEVKTSDIDVHDINSILAHMDFSKYKFIDDVIYDDFFYTLPADTMGPAMDAAMNYVLEKSTVYSVPKEQRIDGIIALHGSYENFMKKVMEEINKIRVNEYGNAPLVWDERCATQARTVAENLAWQEQNGGLKDLHPDVGDLTKCYMESTLISDTTYVERNNTYSMLTDPAYVARYLTVEHTQMIVTDPGLTVIGIGCVASTYNNTEGYFYYMSIDTL